MIQTVLITEMDLLKGAHQHILWSKFMWIPTVKFISNKNSTPCSTDIKKRIASRRGVCNVLFYSPSKASSERWKKGTLRQNLWADFWSFVFWNLPLSFEFQEDQISQSPPPSPTFITLFIRQSKIMERISSIESSWDS